MVESQLVVGTLRVINSEVLYQDFTSIPYVPITYGALAYWFPAQISNYILDHDVASVAQSGRLFSIICLAGICVCLTIMAFQRGVPWRWAWITSLPLFWFPLILRCGSQFAPDIPAIFFSLAAWAVLGNGKVMSCRRIDSVIRIRIALALLLWLICFHIKASVIVGQIGFAIESLAVIYARTNSDGLPRKLALFKRLAAIGLGNILMVLLSGILIDYWTDGLWKLNTIDAFAICKFDFANLLTNIVLLAYLGLMIPYLLVLLFGIVSINRTVLFTAFWVTLTVECILMLKQGSHPKYLLGSLTVWCLGAAVVLTNYFKSVHYADKSCPDSRKHYGVGGAYNVLAFIILPLIFSAQLQILMNGNLYMNQQSPPSDHELSIMDKALETYGEENVLVLAPFYALLRDMPYLFVDPFHAGILEDNHWINFNDEIEKLRKHHYKAVIANVRTLPAMAKFRWHDADPFPNTLGTALRKYYRLSNAEMNNSTDDEGLVLWVPKVSLPASEQEIR
jgi:hypothetical protein